MYCLLLLLLSYIFRYKISALRSFTLVLSEHYYMLPIVKINPRTGHEGLEREQMYSSTFPSTSALDGRSKPRTCRFTPGKDAVPIVYGTYTTNFLLGSPDSRVIGTSPPPHSWWSTEYCACTLHNNNTIKELDCRVPSAYIHPSFFAGVRFQGPREERKPPYNWPLPPLKKNCSYFLREFIFFAHTFY
jgi:hypothetical protein